MITGNWVTAIPRIFDIVLVKPATSVLAILFPGEIIPVLIARYESTEVEKIEKRFLK